MKIVFHSVSKALILLCRQRFGVPLAIVQRAVDLDIAGCTIMRTPFTLEKWDKTSLLSLKPLAFNPPEWGQYIYSLTWPVVFDGLLCMMENTHASEHHSLLLKPDGAVPKHI